MASSGVLRPAAAFPAGVVVHIHLQAQPVGLGASVLEQLAPLGTCKRHGPDGRPVVQLHEQHATDPNPLHRLKIGRNPFARHVAVHPAPIHPRPGGAGWRTEIAFPRPVDFPRPTDRRRICQGWSQGKKGDGTSDPQVRLAHHFTIPILSPKDID